MPTKPLRTCPSPGCTGLWDGRGCTKCDRMPNAQGWEDDRERKQKLAANPVCEECERQGRPTVAVTVDHILPFRGRDDPRRLDWDNLQSLCRRHHDTKTAVESKRHRRVVICGPPGAGKKTYVRNNAAYGAMRWDLDAVFSCLTGLHRDQRKADTTGVLMAMLDAFVDQAARMPPDREVWVIVASEDRAARIAERLGADTVRLPNG
jgi:5-methylcytosine-specific restriction protein A